MHYRLHSKLTICTKGIFKDNLIAVTEVNLRLQCLLYNAKMSNYNGILDYKGIGLERFHCNVLVSIEVMQLTVSEADQQFSIVTIDC